MVRAHLDVLLTSSARTAIFFTGTLINSQGVAPMVHLFNSDEIRKIVWKQIEKDVSLGEQAGGSGHLAHVDCKIDGVDEPRKVPEGWEITYRYTVSVTTEFTIYPDNPPWENGYEKTVVVDEKGDVIEVRRTGIISSSWESVEPLTSTTICKDPVDVNEIPIQRVIDLKTGRDITGEYITQRLKELEILADKIIQHATSDVEANPETSKRIYETTYWEIHEKLGSGSIGPATCVASGLMEEKKEELADVLGIKTEDRIY